MTKVRNHAEQARNEFTLQARAMSGGRSFNAEAAVEPFVRLLGDPPRGLVLDLACGPGIVSHALAAAGARVVALDLTPAMLVRTRERARGDGLQVSLQRGSAECLALASESFDAAVTRLSLHHFPNPKVVLAELRRVLRRGARLVVGDIVASPDPEEAALHDALEVLRDPSHQRLLAPAELESELSAASFGIDTQESWENDKSFDEWAAVVADARSMEPVRIVMRELARAGHRAGIDLREAKDGSLRFVHHWRFLAATAL